MCLHLSPRAHKLTFCLSKQLLKRNICNCVHFTILRRIVMHNRVHLHCYPQVKAVVGRHWNGFKTLTGEVGFSTCWVNFRNILCQLSTFWLLLLSLSLSVFIWSIRGGFKRQITTLFNLLGGSGDELWNLTHTAVGFNWLYTPCLGHWESALVMIGVLKRSVCVLSLGRLVSRLCTES